MKHEMDLLGVFFIIPHVQTNTKNSIVCYVMTQLQ